ncbi:MAG: hypothetical protein K2Q24_09470 [Chitinophagaceae bacterium]|jgi:hypothetical protein|nr:hypothetical protein [Chitinophagaceae bacterium]
MKIFNPRVLKWLCIILILSLVTLLISLGNELFTNKYRNNWAFTAMFIFFCIPVAGYIVTIQYCNRVISVKQIGQIKSGFIFFLITCILCFVFSVITLFLICFAIITSVNEGEPLPESENLGDLLAMIAIVIYALVGPFVFLLQLQLRKQLLAAKDHSIDWLIDSIGTETNNSND